MYRRQGQRAKKKRANHGLSQDLETGCLKLDIEKLLGIQIFEGYHNTLRFQPSPCMNLSK